MENKSLYVASSSPHFNPSLRSSEITIQSLPLETEKGPRSSGTRVDQIARVVFHCRSIRSRLVDRRFATYLSNAFRRDRYSWRTGVRRDRGTDYAVDQARVRAEFRGLDATSIDRTRQRGVRRGMNLEKGGESVDLSRWRTIFDRGRVFRMIFGKRMER